MRLLVSVRTAAEVAAGAGGGADIIDAKEPAAGSLGAVTPDVLREIAALVPAGVPLSVALGDFAARRCARGRRRRAVACSARGARRLYLKLGFAR